MAAAIEGFIGGRVFLPAYPGTSLQEQKERFYRYPYKFRVLSYNVLAECNIFTALNYCVPQAAVWEKRKRLLMAEICSFNAHILCLQGKISKRKGMWLDEAQYIT